MPRFEVEIEEAWTGRYAFEADTEDEARAIAKRLFQRLSPDCPVAPSAAQCLSNVGVKACYMCGLPTSECDRLAQESGDDECEYLAGK